MADAPGARSVQPADLPIAHSWALTPTIPTCVVCHPLLALATIRCRLLLALAHHPPPSATMSQLSDDTLRKVRSIRSIPIIPLADLFLNRSYNRFKILHSSRPNL